MLHPEYPIQNLKGADYNPRSIEDDDLARLRESVRTLGIVKPIIASGDLIVAGHQRTKALRAIGVETAPVFMLSQKVKKTDEIRFNQLHNGTDLDKGDEDGRVPATDGQHGFAMVKPSEISCNLRGRIAYVRKAICELISKYGNWGACVATADGRVIHAAQYLCACKMMQIPARVYYLREDQEPAAKDFLGSTYGVFSYTHLPKTTYGQTFAQMMRLRDGASGRGNRSQNWEWLLEYLSRHPEARVLDFGCGQADYVRAAKKDGYRVQGIEFFYRKGNAIDPAAVHRMIDSALDDMRAHGLFDVTIADYVLNSVDSLQAEADVLTCLGAFCKPGGLVIFSGRQRERIDKQLRYTKAASTKRSVEFLDDNGMSALYRKGHWHFQKFHTKEEALALSERYFGNKGEYTRVNDTAWRVTVRNQTALPREQQEASIRREFDLMWPDGKSVGMGEKAISSFIDNTN